MLIVVTLFQVSEREEGAVAIHLPIGPLKPRSGSNTTFVKDMSTYDKWNMIGHLFIYRMKGQLDTTLNWLVLDPRK